MVRYKRFFEITIVVIVMLATILILPWLAFAYGFSGISPVNHYITIIFLAIWLLVLLLAVAMRSKMLFHMYNFYWLTVTVVCVYILFAIVVGLDFFEMIGMVLFAFFITPLLGFVVLLEGRTPNAIYVGILIFALCLFFVGNFTKKKALKPTQDNF